MPSSPATLARRRRAFLFALRDQPPFTQFEAEMLTGCEIKTVRRYVAHLVAAGHVRVVGLRPTATRPVTLFEVAS